MSVLDLKSLHGSARYRRDVDNVTTPVTVTSTPSPTTTAQATTAGSTVTDTTQRTTRTTTTEPPTTTRTVTTPPVTQAQSTPQSATKTRISLVRITILFSLFPHEQNTSPSKSYFMICQVQNISNKILTYMKLLDEIRLKYVLC